MSLVTDIESRLTENIEVEALYVNGVTKTHTMNIGQYLKASSRITENLVFTYTTVYDGMLINGKIVMSHVVHMEARFPIKEGECHWEEEDES